MNVIEKIKKGWVHPGVTATLDHNKKVKAQRKRDMMSNLDAYVDQVADTQFLHSRGIGVIQIGRIKGWPDTSKCYECGKRKAKHKICMAELCDRCFKQEQLKELKHVTKQNR